MTPEFMLITFTLFFAGVIAVPIATRLGLGSVLGYLIAGIAIGPVLAWQGVDVIELQHFAELGVVLMLFLIGLEMSPQSLWKMRSQIFILGGLQVGLTTLAVMGIALAFGLSWPTALAIGFTLALSSTAIVNQTLSEKGLLRSEGGQSSFSVLLFQDIAVIPILILIPLLALPELKDIVAHGATAAGEGKAHGHENTLNLNLVDGLNGWQTALVTLAAVALVIGIGTYLTAPVFRFVARANLRELFVVTALLFVLGIALLMMMVGLSPALGTFLAGVAMAGSEYRHELESDISPFKGIFLGIFFITVGASINFMLLSENLLLIGGLTIGLIALKALVLLGLGYVFKLKGADWWLFGLGLAQAGEFGFVLLSFAVTNAAIPSNIAELLLLVVALSMLLTPLLFILYDRVIAPAYSQQQTRSADVIDERAEVIIAGHGRVGGIVNRALRGAGYNTIVVDYSSEQLEILRKFEFSAYYGDATRPDLLHAAGIEEAKVFVIAIDEKESINELARYICQNYPDCHVIARAIDRMHVYELWSIGCRDIIRETYDSSLRTAKTTLEALGNTPDAAQRMIDVFEKLDRSKMLDLADHYDISLPVSENHAYMERFRATQKDWEEQLKGHMSIEAERDG